MGEDAFYIRNKKSSWTLVLLRRLHCRQKHLNVQLFTLGKDKEEDVICHPSIMHPHILLLQL